MADNLTTLTGKLQALLLDNGTLFTAATCTAAIRQTLQKMSLRVPVHAATTLDAVPGQYVYELTDAIAGAPAVLVTDVLRAGDTEGMEESLRFIAYSEDERTFIRLAEPQTSGDLLVRFTQAHTISGLDGASESTLPAFYDAVLLSGAAAQLCAMAAVGRIESNNLNPDVSSAYSRAGQDFGTAFTMGLESTRMMRASARGISAWAWNDSQHTAA